MKGLRSESRIFERSGSGDSFFRVIQRHLHDRFSGRLLALILCELGRQEPAAFLRFLALATPTPKLPGGVQRLISAGLAQFEREWAYRPGRYADVAVLADGYPVMLFEVKEDDVASPRNPEQLDDYLEYIETSADRPSFFHLSRYAPITALPKLRAAAQTSCVCDLRYRHLHEAMRAHELASGGRDPLARMTREYLEDIGVNAYKAINLEEDRTALTFLVTQMSGFGHFHGLGRLHSATNAMRGPDLLKVLLGNAAAIGEWLFDDNRELLKQKPKTRFLVGRRYPRLRLANALAKDDDEDDLFEPARELVGEGTLSVYTMAAISKSPDQPEQWIYVELGQYLTVSALEKQHAELALYAAVHWKGGGQVYVESENWLPAFPSEAQATEELNSHLRSALDQAKLNRNCPQVLHQLEIPSPRT